MSAVVVLLCRANAANVLEDFGFAAALLAVFMRVSGAICTKAGAQLMAWPVGW